MALLNDLDETKPLGSDPKSEGDDHLRQIKEAVKDWAAVAHDLGTGDHLADTIDTAQLVDGAVTTDKLADDAVTAAKIADGAVTAAALAAGVGGKLLQFVSATTAAMSTVTAVIPDDDTLPQKTEGTELLTATITPASASNKIRVRALVHVDHGSQNQEIIMALFRDSGADALAAVVFQNDGSDRGFLVLDHVVTAGATAGTTFKLRVGVGAGTVTINGTSGARKFGGALISGLYLEEIAA